MDLVKMMRCYIEGMGGVVYDVVVVEEVYGWMVLDKEVKR